MNCPACSNTLTEMTAGDIVVDVCQNGCGGIWFDNFELKKVDEKHESAGEALLNISRDPHVFINRTIQRNCPKCRDVVMRQHFFSVKRKVTVDDCPSCAGIWLDAGELAEIRNLYENEDARKEAARQYLGDVVGTITGPARKKSQEELDKAKKVANLFRFICPTNYIPDEQSWGAF